MENKSTILQQEQVHIIVEQDDVMQNDVAEKERIVADHDTDSNKRKNIRLETINYVLKKSFTSLSLYLIVIIILIACGYKEITEHPVNIVFITIISSLITTALGAVIGSSID